MIYCIQIIVFRYILKKTVHALSKQRVLSIQLDITNYCNLNCEHCYHSNHQNDEALNINHWEDLIYQYKALCDKLFLSPTVILCGGEPLLSNNLNQIINLIHQKLGGKCPISILTNGWHISDHIIRLATEHPLHFQISLDGYNEVEHDAIRGKNSFKRLLNSAKQLKDNNIAFHFLTVLSKKSSRNIDKFFILAQEHSAKMMNFTRLVPLGIGKKLSDQTLLKEDLKNAYINIINLSKIYGIPTNTSQPLYNLIDKKYGAHNYVGFQGIVIGYKGDLKVTSRTDLTIGNIKTDSLETLYLNSEILKKLRKGAIEGCGKCPHYSICGGSRNISYALTGSFFNKDPGCWI